MPSEEEKTAAMSEIMYIFRHEFRDEWAPESIFSGKPRAWVRVFNELVEKGFIMRKKISHGFQYKWIAAFPDGF